MILKPTNSNRQFWLHTRPSADSLAPLLLAMVPPICRQTGCRKHCSALSHGMQIRWAEREGDAWCRDTSSAPYFMYCVEHHLQMWPHDKRTNNRHSKPGSATTSSPKRILGGRVEKVCGTLYLTEPPPFEPSNAPPGQRRKVKMIQWADKKKWCRTVGPPSSERRRLDLQLAQKRGLVKAVAQVPKEDRRQVPCRTGPCDGCASESVTFRPSGYLQSAEKKVKVALTLCDSCFGTFVNSGSLYSAELEDYLVPA